MSREAVRFLADVAARPLSTTVSRYQRLHLSRRKGNAIRQDLSQAGLIEAVAIPTRSGQVMLYQLTDAGRTVCADVGIDAGPAPRVSLEHRYWARRAADMFADRGFEVTHEYAVQRQRHRRSAWPSALANAWRSRLKRASPTFPQTSLSSATPALSRVILLATSPSAVTACQRAIRQTGAAQKVRIEQLTWLDIS
jgi:hypothetical protein